ncbi:efflux transporter outer membrane subunit [Sphingobium sufflavum]|uniref:efflux transporter outer membrane subunit n=1 Tax=Sphingobium sufflavum TaxID=1129547 RepID=UPI001F3F680F|nr:efflux transporter outer membrane subunit [Sphingobium sufflavum]MCE7795692.1 efflux transporter outer membrane subunit [Sphingobium sufflavum]
MTRRPLRHLPPLLATALSACSMAPGYERPAPPVPLSWPVGDAYLVRSEAGVPTISYRDIFRDARLQALVEQALANNRDLREAAANLAAARAQVRVQRAQQFPEIVTGLSASRDSGANRAASSSFALDAGISAFELDLFGRLANATDAERQRALSTEAAARTVRLGLVADIADAWSTHAADAELLRIAQDTVASAQRSVGLTAARLKGGIAPRTDLRQAEQILATAQADVAAQTTALAQDVNLLRLLVGAPVDASLLPTRLDEVAGTVATLPPGASSDILLRRPDVLEAEYGLRAANAEIGVARAALFPRITLTGLLGFASDSLRTLLDSASFHNNIGGDANQAIFSAGGVRAGVAASKAQRDAALAVYEKAIQTAFREVADALARQGTIADEMRASTARVTASSDTARLTEARYRGGVDSYLENLDAQRSLYSAQQQEIATRLTLVANRIALYRALGGDQATAAGQ